MQATVVVDRVTCPLCHTPAVMTTALESDANWTCAVCAQNWDAERLERVAVYAAYVATHPVRASNTASVPGKGR